MDSWSKSAVVGRLAGPVFCVVGAILYFGFDIVIDEDTAEMGTRMIADTITGIFFIWGTAAPFISKLRQQKESEKRNSQHIVSKIRSKVEPV